MLHGYGATVPVATRARGVGAASACSTASCTDFNPAGGGRALTETIVQVKSAAAEGVIMSMYTLRHDEANCIGCQACEVHCKTNKGLVAGPAPWKSLSVGPVDVGGAAKDALRVHALLPLRGGMVHQGLSDGCDAAAREGRHYWFMFSPTLCRLQKLHCCLSLGRAAVSASWATDKVVKCDYCMIASMPGCSRPCY